MQVSIISHIKRFFAHPSTKSTQRLTAYTDKIRNTVHSILTATPHMIILDDTRSQSNDHKLHHAIHLTIWSKIDVVLIGQNKQYYVHRNTTIDQLHTFFGHDHTNHTLNTQPRTSFRGPGLTPSRPHNHPNVSPNLQHISQLYHLPGASYRIGPHSITLFNKTASIHDLFLTAARILIGHPHIHVIIHHNEFCVDASDFIDPKHTFNRTHTIVSGLMGTRRMHTFLQQRTYHKKKHKTTHHHTHNAVCIMNR